MQNWGRWQDLGHIGTWRSPSEPGTLELSAKAKASASYMETNVSNEEGGERKGSVEMTTSHNEDDAGPGKGKRTCVSSW